MRWQQCLNMPVRRPTNKCEPDAMAHRVFCAYHESGLCAAFLLRKWDIYAHFFFLLKMRSGSKEEECNNEEETVIILVPGSNYAVWNVADNGMGRSDAFYC